MKRLISILIISLLVFSVGSISLPAPVNERAKENSKAAPPGLEKVVFIHYKKGLGKPPWAGGGKKESKCYDFLAKWAKWKDLPVDYVIDPDNPDGLTEDFVTSAISAGAEEWDAHTSAELFGNYSIDHNATWDSDAPDGRNENVFGDYPEEGVIAVTVVWGYFSGPPQTREIIEFDILYDTDFTWGNATVDPTVMDLRNIATHEIGHGAGLADLYDTVCAEETMYGYSEYGETKKRDLNTGDIAGIQKLYGV